MLKKRECIIEAPLSQAPSREPIDIAHDRVCELVETFRANERFYLSPAYIEAEARKDFLDKFFSALGWDVNHETQRNPYEQEVKVERRTDISLRKADYAFAIAPNYSEPRMYVEAKSPDGNLATRDNCFQALLYGWTGSTPITVLTSFEQLCLLDSRFKPDIATAADQIVRRFTYLDLLNKETFAEIYFLLSREAVSNGALAKFAAELPRNGRKAPSKLDLERMDNVFLAELDEHRRTLARAFKAGNPALQGETLTEITQRVIDRLVFIRFLEDRLIEPHPLVAEFGNGKGSSTAWKDFITTSRRLDTVYNGIVFKRHGIIDAPKFRLDDVVFKEVCDRLSHRNALFNFARIPIHILGSIYERFLGKVISVKGKSVDVVEKPEVRKAGGVYYTPQYIVQYIVDETVSKLIAEHGEDSLQHFRFADLACGSGSFLIAVYDSLLRHYTRLYVQSPELAEPWALAECDGTRRLTLRKKRKILLRHVYGVDVDGQAIDVANLALYLKLLDEETPGTAHEYQQHFKEPLLPPLNQNVVSGNALIGPDDLRSKDFTEDAERKLNAMDFDDRFPAVAAHGGFDAIVGNPPYVGNDTLPDDQKQLYRTRYLTGKCFDLYQCFIERGIERLAPNGLLGLILPNTFLTGQSYERLRALLLDSVELVEIVDLPQDVFEGVKVDNVLLFVRKKAPTSSTNVGIKLLATRSDKSRVAARDWDQSYTVDQYALADGPGRRINLALTPPIRQLFTRIERESSTLEAHFDVCDGLIPYETKAQASRSAHTAFKRRAGWDKLIRAKAVARYSVSWLGEWIHYGPHLWRKRDARFFTQPKILLHAMRNKTLARRLVGALDRSGLYNTDNLVNVIAKPVGNVTLEVLLAVLNSRLVNFWYRLKYPNVNINPNELATVPIPAFGKHEAQLIELVESLNDAQAKLTHAKTEKDKNFYGAKVTGLDRDVDNLVTRAFKLTDDERRLLEAAFKPQEDR